MPSWIDRLAIGDASHRQLRCRFGYLQATYAACPHEHRELGATEAVKLEKDKLQIADMDYVVRTYLDYLYRVDQRSRAKDIEAALRLTVPGEAKSLRSM